MNIISMSIKIFKFIAMMQFIIFLIYIIKYNKIINIITNTTIIVFVIISY